jgi:hypothetical protein
MFKWFEQNPIEPIVVGLSDEQVNLLAESIGTNQNWFVKKISEWLKTQTFAVKEVPVWLGDSQFKKVARHLANAFDSDDYIGYEAELRRALDEYTAKPSFYNNAGKVYNPDGSVTDYKADYESVAGNFVSLKEEYSKLKLRLESVTTLNEINHQAVVNSFSLNWEDAPATASYLSQILYWFDDNHMRVGDVDKLVFYRPKPPAPKVEVGQVWKNQYGECKVFGVNDKQVVRQYKDDGFMITSLEDFLAKFERVGE